MVPNYDYVARCTEPLLCRFVEQLQVTSLQGEPKRPAFGPGALEFTATEREEIQ